MWKDYNDSGSNVTQTTTVSGSGTTEYEISNEINASAGFDYAVIHGDMQAETTTTLGKTYGVSGSHSVTVSIPSHEYGISQFGGWRLYNEFNYRSSRATARSPRIRTFR